MKTTFYATLLASMLASTAFAAEVKGYLYTTLNGETINQVIAFERNGDGGFFEEDGTSGGIGFSWDNNSDNMFVSNFNLTKRDHSLTALHHDARKVSKVSTFGTGDGADIDEVC